MTEQRKVLSALCLVAAVGGVVNSFIMAYHPITAQVIWDYVFDPLVIILIGLTVLCNVRDSLRVRNGGGSHLAQLPRDVITALGALVGLRYGIQYLYKFTPGIEPTAELWGHLLAAVLVVLVFEAMSLWRSASTRPS